MPDDPYLKVKALWAAHLAGMSDEEREEAHRAIDQMGRVQDAYNALRANDESFARLLAAPADYEAAARMIRGVVVDLNDVNDENIVRLIRMLHEDNQRYSN